MEVNDDMHDGDGPGPISQLEAGSVAAEIPPGGSMKPASPAPEHSHAEENELSNMPWDDSFFNDGALASLGGESVVMLASPDDDGGVLVDSAPQAAPMTPAHLLQQQHHLLRSEGRAEHGVRSQDEAEEEAINMALIRTAIHLHQHQAAMHYTTWLKIEASQSGQHQQHRHPGEGGGVPIGMSPSTERNNEEMSRRKQEEAHGNGGDVTFRWKNGLAGKDAVGPTTKKAAKVVWKKYGKRIVVKSEKMRSMPHHRCYYKCNYPGCSVKKTEDIVTSSKELTQTTFYGDHNHDVDPAAYYPNGLPDPERTTWVKPAAAEEWQWEEYNPAAAAMPTGGEEHEAPGATAL